MRGPEALRCGGEDWRKAQSARMYLAHAGQAVDRLNKIRLGTVPQQTFEAGSIEVCCGDLLL